MISLATENGFQLRDTMDNAAIPYRGTLLACAIVIVALLCSADLAGEAAVNARITYEIADGIYVNAGTDQGLRPGLLGSLRLDDGRTFEFEVLHTARQSSLLRLRGGPGSESLLNRTVELAFQYAPLAAKDSEQDTLSKTEDPNTPGRPVAPAGPEGFVPLLTPVKRTPEFTGSHSVSHGQIRVRQTLQTDSESDLEYLVTRMNSSGSIERLEGSPWNFSWSGSLRYRDGDGYGQHRQYRDPHLDLYEAIFQRSVDDGGFLRFGRFLPRELPGIGPVDGLQVEALPDGHLRLGAVAGFKPSRIDLEASGDEPLAVTYTTLEAGDRNQAYYSGTMGLLGSMYNGEMNRLALLVDQRGNLGPNLTFYSTAEVDFDVGVSKTRDGTSLTRLNTYIVSKITPAIRLRGGVDHWERPDNLAERDLLLADDDRFFDHGYWRYWVGSSQNLTQNLRISEEVSYVDSTSSNRDARWRLGVTKTGLFSRPDAAVTLSIYNLVGNNVDGYGARISGHVPLLDRKLFVQPSAGFRMLETDPEADDFTLTYLSLHLDGRLSKNWRLQGGATYSFGDEVDTRFFELGVRFSW